MREEHEPASMTRKKDLEKEGGERIEEFEFQHEARPSGGPNRVYRVWINSSGRSVSYLGPSALPFIFHSFIQVSCCSSLYLADLVCLFRQYMRMVR